MKFKVTVLGLVLVIMAVMSHTAYAVTTTYKLKPSTSDIFDLDHYKFYSWGIDLNLPDNEVITKARIFIKNINNWTIETNDILYVNLLDKARLGLRTYTDDQLGGNNFDSWAHPHILLDTYTDLDDFPGDPENYSYYFDPSELYTLNQYVSNDNRFGLGFDADCHYWNDGVKLILETQPVPEPATLLLLGSGLLGSLRYYRREKAV